jgi:cob(I)alamin adenosyltransferase
MGGGETMRLYTKTGDGGETGLIGGQRVPKDDVRVAAYGDVDELNAVIGVAAAACRDESWRQALSDVQADLFTLGAQLATADGEKPPAALEPTRVAGLERLIDMLAGEVPPLRNFVLPGGCELAARFHHARTVCRRAERAVVTLGRRATIDPTALVYLNRLGDLLFAWALAANERAGAANVIWRPDRADTPRLQRNGE